MQIRRGIDEASLRLVVLQKERIFPSSRHRFFASLRRCRVPFSDPIGDRPLAPGNGVFQEIMDPIPDFRTEWWYFTGNLSDPSANVSGTNSPFSDKESSSRPRILRNPWSVRDLFPAHFTLTDVSAVGLVCRAALPRRPWTCGAAEDQMDVWLLNWSATNEGEHDPD